MMKTTSRVQVLFFAMVVLGALCAPRVGLGQTNNFFSNTQHLGQVSTGSGGGCPNCPGFNPTVAGGLLQHVDISQCPGASSATPCVAPFFDRLGTGAVTDNMFGLVSSADREAGPDGLLGTADDTFTKCGALPSSPTNLVQALAGLNCGSLRYDPTTQGMSVTTDPNTMGQLTGSNAMSADYFPSDDAHLGISLQNNFLWRNPSTDPCGTSTPAPPVPSCTTASLHILQVNGLVPGQAGSLLAPGAGEQVAEFWASWSTNNTSSTAFNLPTVTWSQNLVEPGATFFNPSPALPDSPLPCQSTAGANPSLIHCGSFTYSQTPVSANPSSPGYFPQVNYPLGDSMSSPVQGTVP